VTLFARVNGSDRKTMFTLDQVVPWGRSFEEYRAMFDLSEDDLSRSILGCGDGPASFNAESTLMGGRVTSCDPLYQFTKQQIKERIAATFEEVIEQHRRNAHEFVWGTRIKNVEQLGLARMAAMQRFLNDYELGKSQGRYLGAELPTLPFGDAAFDLALCSHFLFLYSSQLGEAFHRAAVREVARVATEVRLFPLVALNGDPSPFVERCMQDAHDAGLAVSIEKVPYEFRRGGDEMMRLTRRNHPQ
jgi:hypothetical protein